MKLAIGTLVLSLAVPLCAQQQGKPPGAPPPYNPPPTFPQSDQHPQTMPPERSAPQTTSPADVQQQIQSALSNEPALKSSNVSVQVDDKVITLTGTVKTEDQHNQAVRIAQSSAGDRQVMDKIQVQK